MAKQKRITKRQNQNTICNASVFARLPRCMYIFFVWFAVDFPLLKRNFPRIFCALSHIIFSAFAPVWAVLLPLACLPVCVHLPTCSAPLLLIYL